MPAASPLNYLRYVPELAAPETAGLDDVPTPGPPAAHTAAWILASMEVMRPNIELATAVCTDWDSIA